MTDRRPEGVLNPMRKKKINMYRGEICGPMATVDVIRRRQADYMGDGPFDRW